MSGTVFVSFRERGFWATSTATMLLLASTIGRYEEQRELSWLAPTIDQWRIEACVRDLGITLEDSWDESQIDAVVSLVAEAVASLRVKQTLTPEEANAWVILDDLHVDNSVTFTKTVELGGAVEVGLAVGQLLSGALPSDPPSGWWFYGDTRGQRQIARRLATDTES